MDITRRQAFGPPSQLSREQLALDNSPEILGITGAFFAAAAIAVLLRCYVRIHMLRIFGIDDWVMVAAMVLCTATFVGFVVRVHFGLGHHFIVMLMNPEHYVGSLKTTFAQSITSVMGMSALKISIALTLLRLSVQRPYKEILWGTIIFITVMTLACVGTLVFQCLPVHAAWTPALRPPPMGTGTANCYSEKTFRDLGLMNSIFNLVTDVLLATLPIPLIWQLSLNIRTKMSLIFILSLGWFACGAGTVKAVKQYHVFEDLDFTVSDSFNVWAYVEFTVGTIAACLPTLKPLFKNLLERTRGFSSGTRSRTASFRVKSSKNSMGYQTPQDPWQAQDIALNSYASKGPSTPTSSKAPYAVKITTRPNTSMDKEEWEQSRKDSDEGVWPLQAKPHHALGSNNNNSGIMMTHEIRREVSDV